MAFQLQLGETLPEGIRRIVLEQIDAAIALLTPPIPDQETAIHDARRCFKKVRGVLRLVRDEVEEEVYQLENQTFRDMARKLAEYRDATTLIEALQNLAQVVGETMPTEEFQAVRALLTEMQAETSHKLTEHGGPLQETEKMLQETRHRAETWPLERDRFAAINRGLFRTYRRGRRAYYEVVADASVEHLHEWRKEVKYLWYQLRILEPIWPEVLKSLVRELKTLSDELGDDHDLVLLHAAIVAHPSLMGGGFHLRALPNLIETRRADLQAAAMQRGARIYSEKPKMFVGRIRGYWGVWRRNNN